MTDAAEVVHYDPPPVVLRDGYRFDRYLRADYIAALAQGRGRVSAANHVGISVRQVRQWIRNDPEFAQAVRDAEASADDNVQDSLYLRAVGHDAVDADGNRYWVPGSVEAQKFWLANRRQAEWAVGVAKGNVVVAPSGEEIEAETLDEMRARAQALIDDLIRRREAVDAAQAETLDLDVIDAESEEIGLDIPAVPERVSDPWADEA